MNIYRHLGVLVTVTVASLFFGALPTHAHVKIGQYAGSYAVAFVSQPGSPFVGETVQMTFYLKNLQGVLVSEPFIVAVIVQEILSDDEEIDTFVTAPETIDDGIYEISYRFTKPGHYRIEYSFGKPDEPNVVRETIHDLEVRDVPRGVPYVTALAVFILGTVLAFLGGFVLGKNRSG